MTHPNVQLDDSHKDPSTKNETLPETENERKVSNLIPINEEKKNLSVDGASSEDKIENKTEILDNSNWKNDKTIRELNEEKQEQFLEKSKIENRFHEHNNILEFKLVPAEDLIEV